MQQFIPFEDEWDMLDAIRPEALTPYRVGLVLVPAAAQSTVPTLPSIPSASPSRTPIRLAVPADSSST